MGISIYHNLIESYSYEELTKLLKSNLLNIKDSILEYIEYGDEELYSSMLDKIIEPLNKVINLFNELGFTFEPEITPDVDEDSFKTILSRYREQINEFIGDISRDRFEAFGTISKSLSNLIDIHRTRYIKEGEILVDTLSE